MDFQKLTPIDDAGIDVYDEALDYVFDVYPAPKTAAARGLNRTLAACRTAPPPLI